MKRSNQLIIAFILLISIFSCKKDELTLTAETLSGKWNNSFSSIYESFEFNTSGNYLIVRNDSTAVGYNQIILFGTYEIDANTVVLSDFGTLAVTALDDNSISFSFTPETDPASEVFVSGAKQAAIANSAKTKLLCKTWEIYSVNGKQAAGTDYELTILFSEAGSYFVSFANPKTESDGGLAQWTWKDATESTICYSWTGLPTCSGNNEVEITALTETDLTITESNVVYVLQLASNTKSGFYNTNCNGIERRLKNGFFNR